MKKSCFVQDIEEFLSYILSEKGKWQGIILPLVWEKYEKVGKFIEYS